MPILLCLIGLQLSSLWGLPCPTSTRKRGLGNQLTAPFSSLREHSLPLCEASDVWGRRPRHLVIKGETWDILVNSIRSSVMTEESSNGEMLWSTTNCLRWFPLWYLEIVLGFWSNYTRGKTGHIVMKSKFGIQLRMFLSYTQNSDVIGGRPNRSRNPISPLNRITTNPDNRATKHVWGQRPNHYVFLWLS